MNNLVPTFETCKKLKEAGIEIDSHLWSLDYYGSSEEVYTRKEIYSNYEIKYDWTKIPRPTIQELFDELYGLVSKDISISVRIIPEIQNLIFKYFSVTEKTNLSEALAQLLLKLKSENLL